MSSLATEILDDVTDRHAGTDLNGSRVRKAAHLAVNWLFVAGGDTLLPAQGRGRRPDMKASVLPGGQFLACSGRCDRPYAYGVTPLNSDEF